MYSSNNFLYEFEMPDLRSMQYFVHVAELGSFSRAADFLRLTQPAVSRQVRKLEADVGVPLLDRRGRHVVPTEAGQMLMLRARELGREASRIFEDVRAGADKPAGSLAVGVSTVIGNLLLPAVVASFVGRFPGVRLHVSEGYSGFVEEWLEQGRIDVGLLWGRPKSGNLDLQPLMAVPMCLIAPPKPLRRWESARPLRETCTMREVVDLPLILPALPHALRLLAESAAGKAGKVLNVAMEVDGLPLANEMVRAGLGYTLMTHPGPLESIHSNKVRSLPIRLPEVLWVLSFATRKGTRKSPAIREFMAATLEACQVKLRRGELSGRLVTRQTGVAAGRAGS